jgi:GTP cyclohydrolase IA
VSDHRRSRPAFVFRDRRASEAIQDILKPQGVGVVIEAEHSCLTLRGVNTLGSTLTTSRLLGVIRDDPRTREEFLSQVRGA